MRAKQTFFYDGFVAVCVEIPDTLEDLLDGTPIAHIATTKPDGAPHVVPVWIDFDGDHFLIAGRRDKQRHVNIREEPRVALTIMDPDNPYTTILVHGEVGEITTDGALEFLDEQTQRYLGKEKHPIRDEDRLLVKIKPNRIIDASAEL